MRLFRKPGKKTLTGVLLKGLLLWVLALVVFTGTMTAADYVRVKNVWQGTYLYENGGQVLYGTPGAADQTSHWEVISATGGSVRLRNRASGNYMHMEDLQSYVQCGSIELTWDSARWFIEDAGGAEKCIRSAWWIDNYIHIENLQGYAQRGTIYPDWESARWILENVDGAQPTATPTSTPTATPTPTPVSGQGPYGGVPWAIPGIIQAEHYDTGGQNVAYYDTSGRNSGGAYRSDDVDIEGCSDSGGGYNVGWIVNGEWLEYTVDVAQAGTYDVEIRAASQSAGGSLGIAFNGVNKTGTVSFGATGGWQNWTTVQAGGIFLDAGQQVMRINMQSTDFNVNWVRFTEAGGPTATPTPTSTSTPETTATPTPTPGEVSGETIMIKNNVNGQYLYQDGHVVRYGNKSPINMEALWEVEDTPDGYKWIKNVQSGHCMHIENLQPYVECTTIQTSWESAKWTLQTAGSGRRINNRWNAWKYINLANLAGYAECSDAGTYDVWTFEHPFATPTPTPPPVTPPPTPIPGSRGATVPWIKYEAEDMSTNATVIGPGREATTPEAEASGRRAVRLTSTGHYVQFTADEAANGMVIRYCIPDAPGGGGMDATISLYVNGAFNRKIDLTSKHSWLYGPEHQVTNNPSAGPPRVFFDEVQVLLDEKIPTGSTVRLQKASGDNAAYYIIDFVELEDVQPPLTMPANFISITEFGATPNDSSDDTYALEQAYYTAKQQGKGVWIPEGTFIQTRQLLVDDITFRGAGMWHSKLYCPLDTHTDRGYLGFILNGDNLKFHDFAMFSGGTSRETGGKPFCNYAGPGSVIENIWIEHTTCALWIGSSSGITDGLIVRNCRFRNTYADCVNLCNSTRNSLVENCHARNTGDDAFATWSARDLSPYPCENNIFRYNTAENIWRAAGFAVYGGKNNKIQNGLVTDTLVYPGITISSCFNPYVFEGNPAATIENMGVYRCGGAFWNGIEFGAVWMNCDDSDISNVVFSDIDIYHSTYSGLHIQSESYQKDPKTMTNIVFENINIVGSGTDGIFIRYDAKGEGTFRYVTVTGSAGSPLQNDSNTYTIIRGPGNSGW